MAHHQIVSMPVGAVHYAPLDRLIATGDRPHDVSHASSALTVRMCFASVFIPHHVQFDNTLLHLAIVHDRTPSQTLVKLVAKRNPLQVSARNMVRSLPVASFEIQPNSAAFRHRLRFV